MNLFEDPPVDLFSQVGPQAEAQRAMETEAARRTAQLAALAARPNVDEGGSVIRSLQERAAGYQQSMEIVGDSAVRNQIAAERNEDRAQALEGLLRQNLLPEGSEEMRQGAVIAYNNVVNLRAEEEADYALEQQAVRRIQDLASGGNITQARIMLLNLERGGALDVIADHQAKQQILQAALERQRFTQQDQSWMRDVADFALSVIPLYSPSRTGNVDVADSVKGWFDSFFSGGRYRREAEALWDMDAGELAEFVNGDFLRNLHENATFLGYTNNTEQLELMSGLIDRTPSAFETNAWAALDIGGFVPWTKAARLGGGLTSTLVRSGARREATEVVIDAARAVINEAPEAAQRSGMSVDNLANNLQVSATAPEGTFTRVPLAVDAASGIRRGDALLAEYSDLERSARLSQGELDAAKQTLVTRYTRLFGRDVKDVNVVNVGRAGGRSINRVEFTLGRKDGGGFASEAQANRYGGSVALDGRAIQDESGQWFYRTSQDIPETGFFSQAVDVLQAGPLRHVLGARNVGDRALANAAQQASNARSRLLKTLVEPYSATFQALRGDEKAALAQVMQAGDIMGRWFDDVELGALWQRAYKRPPSARELDAYRAAIDINDMEFALRNDDLSITKSGKGYKTVSFDTGRGNLDRVNAIVDRELRDAPPAARVFDVSSGRHYADELGLTAKQWDRMRGQGYQLVTVEVPLKMADGTTVKHFLVKGKDMVVENLRRDQIAYRPGGHRMYEGKYFVKQTVWGRQADNGKEFLENPNTYIVAKTKAEANFWASRMEAARLAHLNGEGLDVIDEIFGGHAGFPTAEDFVRMLDDPAGAYQKNTPFGVYFDRQMPSEYANIDNNLQFVDPEDTGLNGFLRQTGRMYTGRKGEILPDFQGQTATLLDPYRTINTSLMNIASLTSFGDYKIKSVERWMKQFGPYLDKEGLPKDWSDVRQFLEAPFKTGNDQLARVRNAGVAQREIIMRTLGWKTEADLAADQFTRQFSEWVAGDAIDGVVPSARRFLSGVDWMADTDPVGALKSFAFDLKMGMFNIAQLPLQLGTAVAATTMSPKLGMQGWSMIMPMRFILGGKALSKEALETRLDEMVKRGVHDMGGFSSSAEFKLFARSAARSGFFDLNGSHALIDHMGAHATMDGFMSGVNRTREAGRFFFNEAERWNRIVAWRIAWGEVQAQGLKAGSPEFSAALAGRAEEFAFNMSRESRAWWQKGLLSVPTQFWAYNARMIEAMTVGNFTLAQKARLVAFQSILYGSAGIPIVGAISSLAKGKDPSLVMEGGALDLEANPLDSPFATLDRGLLDQAILSFTGADVLAGARFGTGGWLVDTVKNIMGMSAYGEVSAADMLGGATFNIMGKLGADVMRPIIEYMAAESGDSGMLVRSEALIRLASNVSLLSNGYKAYLVANYGVLRSGSGGTQVTDLPSQTAFATMLGINPAEMEQAAAISAFRRNRSDHIKEAAKVITNYRVDLGNRPDQRETIMEEINIFTRMLPPDIRREALERANGDTDPSFHAGLVEYYEKQQLEAEANGQTD